jgi:hypothetical protein
MRRQIISSALLVLIGFVFVFFDIFRGVSKSLNWTVAVLLIGLLVAFLPLVRQRSSVKALMGSIGIYAIFLAGIVAIRQNDDQTPIGRFQKVYSNIRPGMTIAEVEALVRREFPAVQPSIRWHTDVGFLGLDPVDHEYNAEFIEIRLDKNVVTGVDYLPD